MMNKVERADLSLGDVHGSVRVPRNAAWWRRLLAFVGPGYIIAVGYMDPGNWATDLAGGSSYGYTLLAVVLAASLFGMVLQGLSAWLGISTGRDLAQLSRDTVPAWASVVLWLGAEGAIIGCDIAEVIGGAIALNLLFGLPLLLAATLTILDAFLILLLLRRGMRLLEAAVMALIGVIAVSLLAEIALAHPALAPIAAGLLPHANLITNPGMLYVGVGIIGATVMPHNLYLHSALVQSRHVGAAVSERKNAIKWALLDSCVALLFAFFVNAAILVMAASVFHAHGRPDVQDLGSAFSLLAPILGSHWAPLVFGAALLASGLNATVTGTLAGQVVMEGLLRLKFSAAFQRLLTRGLAVLPVLGVIALAGRHGVGQLLVLSQVVLSLQLPFAMLPLIYFTSRAKFLGALLPPLWLRALGWIVSVIILVFDAALLATTL
jgi:manganese transport protein